MGVQCITEVVKGRGVGEEVGVHPPLTPVCSLPCAVLREGQAHLCHLLHCIRPLQLRQFVPCGECLCCVADTQTIQTVCVCYHGERGRCGWTGVPFLEYRVCLSTLHSTTLPRTPLHFLTLPQSSTSPPPPPPPPPLPPPLPLPHSSTRRVSLMSTSLSC